MVNGQRSNRRSSAERLEAGGQWSMVNHGVVRRYQGGALVEEQALGPGPVLHDSGGEVGKVLVEDAVHDEAEHEHPAEDAHGGDGGALRFGEAARVEEDAPEERLEGNE
eukprot:43222-Pyramimonas_sp.AAC.1